MNFVARIHHHRRALFVLLALGLVGGVFAVQHSARAIYPGVAFPRIVVIAERGEQPVQAMLAEVTRPMERALVVPGLTRVRSKTVRGASELSLDFAEDTDMLEALSEVRARVAQAGLPGDVELVIERQTPAVFPVLSVNVIPGEAQRADAVARAELAEWIELELAPRLSRLPDAFRVTVQSGDTREFVFEVDPLALAAARLDVLDVEQALRSANQVAAVGLSSTESLQYQLLVDGRFRSVDEVTGLAIAREGADPILLGSLGRVIETTATRSMIVTGGGADGVVVSVMLRDGGKVTDLSRDVTRVLDEIAPGIPFGGRIEPVYDQAQLVEASIDGVRDAIALGALLSIVVIALFLADWRMTLVASVAVPVSVLLTIALFPLIGESLNLMSLGGLAVAIGLIIDDSIVVVENVARRRHLDPDRSGFHVVCEATGEVFGAIVGSSLTTVVVFLPLVLLPGVVGQFFRSLSLALGVSIVVSMVISLVYAPLMLASPWLLPRPGVRARRLMTRLQDGYARMVGWSLRRPLGTIAILLTLLMLGMAGVRGIGSDFLPQMDEGGFVLDYTLPVGTSLLDTDATCRRIESILRETDEVASFSRRTGAELGFFATEQFTGDMLVGLKPRSHREHDVFEVIDGLRERFAHEVPQAEVEFVLVMADTIADLEGNPEPIEVKILGAEYPVLQDFANAVADRIGHLPGVVDVANHVSFGSPELTWRPDPVRAAAAGLTTESIAAQMRAQRLGSVATRVQQGDRFLDLRVRYPSPWRNEVEIDGDGPDAFVTTRDGKRVPLRSVASFERRLAENELERENQVPMVRVTAKVAGTDLGSASAAVAAAVAGLPRPAGVRFEMDGTIRSQERAFDRMLIVFALGSGLVFLLLVVQFRSLRLPAVLFLALPFGQVGGLLALRMTGITLNIGSGMGLIMLVGLVVKNGIILIEHAQQRRREGLDEREAITAAARVRLRPILMTTLAAIAGLLPLALGFGAGAELQRPLAVAVIGGLVVSTAFALWIVPLGCALFARGHLVPEIEHASP
ncbi:MAG: efflux RND transporter permease subunit [Planctomycetota bacterium]